MEARSFFVLLLALPIRVKIIPKSQVFRIPGGKLFIVNENDLISVRVEKAEIEGTFLRDKEETREFYKRMNETGKHVEALKAVSRG